jgi:hypothetical protein
MIHQVRPADRTRGLDPAGAGGPGGGASQGGRPAGVALAGVLSVRPQKSPFPVICPPWMTKAPQFVPNRILAGRSGLQ